MIPPPPEAKSGTQSSNMLFKVIIILLFAIVIVIGSIFAIGAFWASHQQQQALDIINGLIPTVSPPTPTPSIWTITMRTDVHFQSPPNEIVAFYTNSPTDVTFLTNNILYNGHSAESYGSFAPVFKSSNIFNSITISQFTIDPKSPGSNVNNALIYFPRGSGSPWASGVTVQMSITTANAKGSTTFTLP
jgi:hypothetical protein